MRYLLLGTLLLFLGCENPYTAAPQQGMPQGMAAQDMDGGASPHAASTQSVKGKIEVPPSLAADVKSGDIIFLIARKAGEAGPPLAVKRMTVTETPIVFELGGADVMMHGASLDGEILVVARVDKDGMAGPPMPGDLEGSTAKPVTMGDENVTIVIDKKY